MTMPLWRLRRHRIGCCPRVGKPHYSSRDRDDRSTWGFDPPDDAYFAQLWRNGSPNENPDIWVFGHGTLDGREFVLASTRTLAQEIAAATGHDLSAVCAAMISGHHDDADDPGDDNEPPEQPGPPISLKDELGKQGWF